MHKQESASDQRGKRRQRLNMFAPSRGEGGIRLEKKRDVRAEGGCDSVQIWSRKWPIKKFVQGQQSGRGVAAAASEPGGHGDFFLQVHPHTASHLAALEKSRRRPN